MRDNKIHFITLHLLAAMVIAIIGGTLLAIKITFGLITKSFK